MATKTKTFVLTVSRSFPQTHKRKGEETFFVDKIEGNVRLNGEIWQKIHTIRSNYDLWLNRIKQVQEGKAILSIRYWSGKHYNSKQVVICQLDKDSGIGVQALYFDFKRILEPFISSEDSEAKIQTYLSTHELAINDGLYYPDFKEWFKGYDLNEPMAIIHFTNFRY